MLLHKKEFEVKLMTVLKKKKKKKKPDETNNNPSLFTCLKIYI